MRAGTPTTLSSIRGWVRSNVSLLVALCLDLAALLSSQSIDEGDESVLSKSSGSAFASPDKPVVVDLLGDFDAPAMNVVEIVFVCRS
jgi:hypothetical protein